MKSLRRWIIFVALIYAVNCLEKARYDNYRVYKITVYDKSQLEILREIENYPDGYRFFSRLSNKHGSKIEIIVPPHKFAEFSEIQERFSIKAELLSINLQEDIDKEIFPTKQGKASFDWSRYWTLNEINSWMDSLVIEYPGVSIFNVGKSYEGREIRGVKVNFNNRENKKSVFVEATIHSNEWIGTTTATYFLNQLLTSDVLEVQELADRYEWYFLLVFNVDGYAFTWENDRMWRKTRRPNKNLLCKGADPNRNFDVRFNEFSTSQNPCSPIYAGDFVFSEVETQQLASFMATVPRLVGYFSFHSLGQQLMIPRGYTDKPMEKFDVLYEIGLKAGEALTAKHGKVYDVGPVTEFFGLVSGISFDWVIDNFQPNVTFCFELRPTRAGDMNGIGQILPPDQILATGEEVFASLVTILKEAFLRGIA